MKNFLLKKSKNRITNNKLKILYVQPILTSYRESIISLLSKKHKLSIAYSPLPNNSGFEEANTNNIYTIKTSTIKIYKNKLIYQKNFLSFIINNKPDVVLACASTRDISYWLTLILCKFLGIKIYSHGQGLYSKINPSRFITLAYKIITTISTKYICYTELSRQSLILAGCKEEKLVTAENSIKFPSTAENISKTGQEIGLLYIGRLRQNCNLELLLQAVNEINKNNKGIILHIIGGGELYEYYKNKYSNESIIFHGSIYNSHEILEISRNCRFGCYPGDAGLSIVHYFALKLPPIVHNDIRSHMGPEPSYIKDHQNGFLFKKGLNYFEFAEELKILYSIKPHDYLKISENAFHKYQEINNPPLEEKILSIIEGHSFN